MEVDGARLACRSIGSRPALLAPECNYRWTPEFGIGALASGGFPLLGDYGITSRDVDSQRAALQRASRIRVGNRNRVARGC